MTIEHSPIDRRPDLDAVRGLAMLLGIALHAALAYIGTAWVVTDAPPESVLGLFVGAVHGFRMPLFFLLSGFFSAMLLSRRGIGGLVSHRARRIFLPLVLSCLTILPAMWAVSDWAIAAQAAHARTASPSEPRASGGAADLWAAAATGDVVALRGFAADAAVRNAPDPKLGVTALGWAAITNQPAAVRVLLELGADPNARYRDGNTPMHTACFFGRAEIAERLLRAGTDLAAVSAVGERPVDALRHDKRTTEFIANLLRVPIDFDAVAAGRDRIRELLAVGVGPQAEAQGWRGWLAHVQVETFFHHLWFLWFLCWLNAGLVVVVLLARFVPRVPLPTALFSMPLCLVWLVPLTMLPQHFMHERGTAPGFGPDTSIGLLPAAHVLLYYAIFFGFGAMAYVARGGSAKLGRFWWVSLPLAFVVLPFALRVSFGPASDAPAVEPGAGRALMANLLQVLYAWLMTFGMLGLCETLLAKPRAWMRYLSDSAYWLYLVHLPLVIAGQVLLLRVEMPALAKFAVLMVGCAAILLASYHVLVRRTPIGRLLNGRRPVATSRRPHGEGELR